MQLQSACHAIAIGRIGPAAVRNMPLLDLLRDALHRARRVVEEPLLFLTGHLPEEIAWLLPVIIHEAVVIVISSATVESSGGSAYAGWLAHNPWLFG